MRTMCHFSYVFLIFCLIFEITTSTFPRAESKDSINYHMSDSINSSHIYTKKIATHTVTQPSRDDLYATLDSINLHEKYETIPGSRYPIPASYWFPEAYEKIAEYGIEAVPYIIEYVIEYKSNLTEESFDLYREDDIAFFIATAYELLGVRGEYTIHWINPDENSNSYDNYGMTAQHLLDYINKNGLRPIYPFLSAEEAAANQDRITRQLEDTSNSFKWYLTNDLSDYQFGASLITVFGEYAVTYILDYILSFEDQPLTPDEEMNLGVLLHLSYRMLDVETTAAWHMPAEPVESTTDPFPYARELVAHLGEYGLEAVP